jgi:nicotinate-nucleotide adenylyltransferase
LTKVIALQGGSFDPIHNGHLALANAVMATNCIDEFHYIPNYSPIHNKTLIATSTHRLAMLELVLIDQPDRQINLIELKSKQACPTINTLQQLRILNPNASLCWVMGSDALATIDQWHEWQSLTNYCHLLVTTRPGAPLPLTGNVADFIQKRLEQDYSALQTKPYGCIIPISMTPMDISATILRQAILQKRDVSHFMPPQVIDYINKNALYR